MDDVVIKVEHLKKVYKLYDKKSDRLKEAIHPGKKKYSKDFYALKDISFDVKRGETIGIIGTNGSGKSTLLKILTGVVAPSGGSYEVNGKVSALLELGAGFNMEYTGLQNIDLQGVMMGYTEEEMKTRREEIIKFADIGDYIKQPVKNYSSGMFARLAFAVAISIDPEILIVDEALSVGDVFFQNKCFRKFDELREKGTSILFVSHDMATVKKLCRRVAWIERGELLAIGPAKDICKKYFNYMILMRNHEQADAISELTTGQFQKIGNAETEILIPRLYAHESDIVSEKATILSAFFSNEEGLKVDTLESGKSYYYHLYADFKEPVSNVIGGVTVEDSKGNLLLAFNSFINGDEQTYNVDKPEALHFMFFFKCPKIRNGNYIFSPAIASGTQEQHVILTWLQSAGNITFVTNGYNQSLIELDSDVQIEKCDLNHIHYS